MDVGGTDSSESVLFSVLRRNQFLKTGGFTISILHNE
jgi:hypothetical protein